MEERREQWLRAHLPTYSELGKFADLPGRSTYGVNLRAVQRVDKQPGAGIQSDGYRRKRRIVAIARRKRYAIRLAVVDGVHAVATPAVAPLDEKARRVAV